MVKSKALKSTHGYLRKKPTHWGFNSCFWQTPLATLFQHLPWAVRHAQYPTWPGFDVDMELVIPFQQQGYNFFIQNAYYRYSLL